MCLKNYRIDLWTLWMNGAYRHSVFKLLLWEYLDSSWERKTWGSLTQHLATLYCLWVQTGISNRCVCLFLPPSYTAMICWPISIHCKTSVSSENQKKAKRKRRIKNKTKQKTTQPSALSNVHSQPNSLGLLLQAVFPSKWKERQQRTEIKVSCSVMRDTCTRAREAPIISGVPESAAPHLPWHIPVGSACTDINPREGGSG